MSNDTLFLNALRRQNLGRPPVWFMRQAGRYHSHYQALRKKHSFMELCKIPSVACEVTMGPIRDFDFDAAILFSDLLFPLEVLGMGLTYGDKGPELAWHLKSKSDLQKLNPSHLSPSQLTEPLRFQKDALELIRKSLPTSKGLLGFIGGPLTLFCYAVDGSHKGSLEDSRRGLTDGRFDGFCETMIPLLAENLFLQVQGGADTIAIMDTCAGEIDLESYERIALPALAKVLDLFRKKHPKFPIIYYTKGTGMDLWKKLRSLDIQGIGIDWKTPVVTALKEFGNHWAIQGNFDPNLMLLPWKDIESKVSTFLNEVKELPEHQRHGWICGLGHGVLPTTPEANVRNFIKMEREIFS